MLDFYDQNGKRRWKTMPKGSTKKQAREQLREIEAQIDRGNYLPDKRIPKFKQVAEDWREFNRPNIRPGTLEMYRGHIENHFGALFHYRINLITIQTVERFIAERQAKGVSFALLRKLIRTLYGIMRYAVRHRYIDYNPVADAERPRGQGAVNKAKIRPLKPSEINTLLDAIENYKYKLLVKTAIMTGARQGEILGLKWSDVEWDKSQIHIQRTFNKGAGYKPKSKSSDRRIDLGPGLLRELKRWRLRSQNTDLIFPNEEGGPMDQANMVKRYFRPALKRAGLDKVRFHDLRHTYASLLVDQGENIKYIQTQMGHSSPNVTPSIY